MKVTVSIEGLEGDAEPVSIAEIARTHRLNAATLGLSLSEAKALLRELQRHFVQAQLGAHAASQRGCRQCGLRRPTKDHRRVCFKSLFGAVTLRVPRLLGCRCEADPGRVRTLAIDDMRSWVAPELEFVQSSLAARVPYAPASELQQASNEDHLSKPRTNKLAAVGLDSGYIRDCRPGTDRHFAVVVGRILSHDKSSRSLGFVRRSESNEEIRHRLIHRIAQAGGTEERIAVFTDGDANLRTLQLDVLPNAVHYLDWYHLTRRVTVLKTVLEGKDTRERLPAQHYRTLRTAFESLKWRLWHGQQWRAVRKLKDILITLRLPTMRGRAATNRLRRHTDKLLRYIENNENSLPNYGARYRAGKRITTSFVESAVNQLVDKRMSKSQQMRWSNHGAHLLLQVRADVIDNRLSGNFERWYPGFRTEEPLPMAA